MRAHGHSVSVASRSPHLSSLVPTQRRYARVPLGSFCAVRARSSYFPSGALITSRSAPAGLTLFSGSPGEAVHTVISFSALEGVVLD